MNHYAENNEAPVSYTCPECQVGIFHLEHITYFTYLGSEMLAVPEFPAWVCDMCGRREYDQRALNWLSVILDTQRTKKSSTRQSRHRRPPVDESPTSTTPE